MVVTGSIAAGRQASPGASTQSLDPDPQAVGRKGGRLASGERFNAQSLLQVTCHPL